MHFKILFIVHKCIKNTIENSAAHVKDKKKNENTLLINIYNPNELYGIYSLRMQYLGIVLVEIQLNSHSKTKN